MEFIKVETELPPAQTLVMVKRFNGHHYLAYRNDKPLATDPDASKDCYWHGANIADLKIKSTEGSFTNASFSDVTVDSWAYLSA